MDAKLFVRDAARIYGLSAWGDAVVVRGEKLWRLDVDAGTQEPLLVDGAVVLDVAARPDGAIVALCKQPDGRAVIMERARSGGNWRTTALPDGAGSDTKQPFRLGADGTATVVWEGTRFYRRDGEKWTMVPLGKVEGHMRGFPKHTLLARGRFLLGYDAGEWGGEVVSFAVVDGALRVEPMGETAKADESLPVHGLAADRSGHVFVPRGTSHLGSREGALYESDASDAWTLVAGSTERDTKSHGWNLERTSFDGVAFDDSNRVYVASVYLGVARREANGSWIRLTPSWPKESVYLAGLLVRGETAIIATFDGGVVVWNWTTGVGKRIARAETKP